MFPEEDERGKRRKIYLRMNILEGRRYGDGVRNLAASECSRRRMETRKGGKFVE